jgi:hypothetical protein
VKFFTFLRGLWDYYILGTWLEYFPSKSQRKQGDDADNTEG